MGDGKVIYSMKYASEERFRDQAERECGAEFKDELNQARLAARLDLSDLAWRRVLDSMGEKPTYVKLPERAKRSRELIRLAQKIAKDASFDIQITEHEEKITIYLSFDLTGRMSGQCLSDFLRLLNMADTLEIFSPEEGWPIMLYFDYYTHEVYRGSRKIAPEDK